MENILSIENEEKLQLLLEILWVEEFYSGKAIAALLGFGENGPYRLLSKRHVSHFVEKFCLPSHFGIHGRRLGEKTNPKVLEKIYGMSRDELLAVWDKSEQYWGRLTKLLI